MQAGRETNAVCMVGTRVEKDSAILSLDCLSSSARALSRAFSLRARTRRRREIPLPRCAALHPPRTAAGGPKVLGIRHGLVFKLKSFRGCKGEREERERKARSRRRRRRCRSARSKNPKEIGPKSADPLFSNTEAKRCNVELRRIKSGKRSLVCNGLVNMRMEFRNGFKFTFQGSAEVLAKRTQRRSRGAIMVTARGRGGGGRAEQRASGTEGRRGRGAVVRKRVKRRIQRRLRGVERTWADGDRWEDARGAARRRGGAGGGV